ncbi:hypothetical protein [Arthrobacter sp. H5]|uniref:hypothetical protein n=1 Tax=Arthrobacter sp. H5 TaxID=1267973 RepID=UPI00048569C7|nr:hypothetical protein [Arthrobacter sp. H5]
MALVLIFGVAIVLLAAIGRGAVPAAERLPLRSWGLRDLMRNVWLGLVICAVDTPLDRTMEEMFRTYR